MRPIDADALKVLILEERDKIPLEVVERYSFGVPFPYKHGQSMRGGIRKALRCLEETPTLDYAPVKRGHYGFVGGSIDWVRVTFGTCSECKTRVAWYKHNNYCPYCGARMDGKEDEELDR